MPERNRAGLSIINRSCASGLLDSACLRQVPVEQHIMQLSTQQRVCCAHVLEQKTKASDNSRPNAPDIQGPRQALIAAVNIATTPVFVCVESAGHG